LADFVIVKEVSGSKGRYVIRKDGEEAELTFSITTPTLVIADHTGVPDSFRGTGGGSRPRDAPGSGRAGKRVQGDAALPLRERDAQTSPGMGGCILSLVAGRDDLEHARVGHDLGRRDA
jgi:hypothetical protein